MTSKVPAKTHMPPNSATITPKAILRRTMLSYAQVFGTGPRVSVLHRKGQGH